MLEGERPEGGSYCWRIEDVGGRSDRVSSESTGHRMPEKKLNMQVETEIKFLRSKF